MPQFVLAPTERMQFLYLRQVLPLAICLACAIFLLASLVAPKGGKGEIIGYEYRCADEFDRAQCADVSIYEKEPFRLLRPSAPRYVHRVGLASVVAPVEARLQRPSTHSRQLC